MALWRLGPDWGGLLHGATHPAVPQGEGHPTWWFFAIALLGAAMTPYDGRYVEWDRVQTVQPDRIHVSVPIRDLSQPEAPESG